MRPVKVVVRPTYETIMGLYNPMTQMVICERGVVYRRSDILEVLEGSLD